MKKHSEGTASFMGKLSCVFIVTFFLMLTCSSYSTAEETKDPLQAKFVDAMAKREKGDLYNAMTLFQSILNTKPTLHRARLELAVTYYHALDYEKAKKEAQIVLDDPQTPANVRVTILAFLAQVESDAKKIGVAGHTFKPYIGVGWMHDTNVNAGPDSRVTITGDLLTPGATKTSDSAFIAEGGITHRYQSGKSRLFNQKNAQVLWQTNANIYHRDYFDEHAYDLGIATISTGPAVVVLGDWRGNINLQEDYIRYGSEDLAYFTSLMPSLTKHFLRGNVELTWDGVFTNEDYQRDEDAGRDAKYWAMQLTLGRVFFNGKLAFQGGASFFDENANLNRYANSGNTLFLATNWKFFDRSNLYGRVLEENRKFDGEEPNFNNIRRDERTRRYTVGLDHTFSARWIKDWKLRGEYMRQDTYSTISSYEYDREQVTVMVERSF